MTLPLTTPRPFVPGTTGWSASDLDDPEIERQWERGAYEIVEGVLTTMPPAYFDGSAAVDALIDLVKAHLRKKKQTGRFAQEVDLIIDRKRIARVDGVFMSAADLKRQKRLNAERGRKRLRYGRLLLPPTLIIESMSMGHEEHDRETKRGWYAEFGVPNYWLLDAYAETLECLVLSGDDYVTDCEGEGNAELRPRAFPGLVIRLKDVWGE